MVELFVEEEKECPSCGKITTWTNCFCYEWMNRDDPTWARIKVDNIIMVSRFDLANETIEAIRNSSNSEFDICDNCGCAIT